MPLVFYCAVAEALRKLEKKQGSLKSIVFSRPDANSKKVYALACQTLKHKRSVTEAIEGCQLLQKEPKLSVHLAMVLVYDLLYGRGVQCGGPLKQAILRHRDELREAARRKDRLGTVEEEGLLPRYVRTNLLKTSTAKVIKRFKKEGYVLLTADQACHKLHHLPDPSHEKGSRLSSPQRQSTARKTASSVTSSARSCGRSTDGDRIVAETTRDASVEAAALSPEHMTEEGQKWMYVDQHVPDLLVFPPATDLTEHKLYRTARIILQDKASCLPAHILSPPPGSTVIDACAAPGNKTTQLAGIMGNRGCIYAFDRSRERFSVLQEMVSRAEASCVQPILMDFLKVQPEEYPAVQFILVDPSCSGSGITGRMDFDHQGYYCDAVRLNRLAKFQKLILRHALSFPAIQRVVYSTCSVNKKENEGVVESALSRFGAEFELVEILPSWENRGLPVFREAAKCIRASPERNLTNGFFVAMFQRRRKRTAAA